MAFATKNGAVRTLNESAVLEKTNKKTGETIRNYIKPGSVKSSL